MKKNTRREFLTTMAGAGALLGTSCSKAVPGKGIAPPPTAVLGKTGIEVSRMAMGTGFRGGKRQSDHTRMGFEKLVDLMLHAYDRGITFFDMADLYGTHIYFREALRTIPRDKVTLLTKLWWPYDSNKPAELSADLRYRSAKKAVERFCHEMTVDTIDILLLHCLRKEDWLGEMSPYMEALQEMKAEGKIRALGVSCHDFGAMKTAAESPWVDVMLSRLNPFNASMDASPEEVIALLKKARANGKGIIGMKIYGNGKLVDRKEECMQFAQSNGVFDAMTIGATTPEQIDENLALMAKYPVV
jgi:aryl-alcohol dehydrogenase-like predicted oxidoreductase